MKASQGAASAYCRGPHILTNLVVRTPSGAWSLHAFSRVSWCFLSDFAASSSGVAVSDRFCDFGRMTWGPRFRTDLGDAHVMWMQDLGAGIACFVVDSEQFGVSCRTA